MKNFQTKPNILVIHIDVIHKLYSQTLSPINLIIHRQFKNKKNIPTQSRRKRQPFSDDFITE